MSDASTGRRTQVDKRAPSAWPRTRVPLLLTAFLGAATVPALLSWTSHDQARVLGRRQQELDELLRAGAEDRRESLPDRVVSGELAAELVRVPAGDGLRFRSELLFSDAQVELFRQKSSREGEFERALKPPDALTAKGTRDEIEVAWESPAGFASLRDLLSEQPLLRLGFRVYRWREGEEPKLLATLEGSKTAYQDRDLPLWRERFFYCVATVLEGTIGDLPTLIESKRSSVITAETQENFALEVLDGTPDRGRFEVSAWLDGQWRKTVAEAGPGEPLRAALTRSRDGAEEQIPLDTGLTVRALRWVEGRIETTARRAEFLPDGRRKLDPETGAPTFRTEAVSLPTRTLVAELVDSSGAARTVASAEHH